MTMNMPSNRFVSEGEPEVISVGSDRVKGYLASKWQEAFEDLSAKNNQALVMYLAVRENGYEINIASEQILTYYDTKKVIESSGADFIDLVRDNARVIIVEDSMKDIRLADSREVLLGFKTLVGMPIVDHHNMLKGIFLMMARAPGAIDEESLKELNWLATSIEESIRYLSVEAEIGVIRNVDPLTRLVSRDKMMANLKLEFERSQRSDMPFSVVMIDIDNFKQINASFGHDVGDAVLREFSKEIASRVRMVDTASRWEGDAFMVMCPHTDLLGANALVNDLFSNLTHHVFANVGRCYFSMGIADYALDDISINDMLIRLDKALYRVKAFGGNSHQTKYH